MPDGTVVTDVPTDITQEELWDRYTASQKAAAPIDKALAGDEAGQAVHQAQRQNEYAARQAAIAKFEQENPQARVGADIMREPAPPIDPYLQNREKPLPPSPVQKFGTAYKLGNVEDEETQRRIMARDLFPNDPNGIDRVGFRDGVPVYVDDKGELQQLTSGHQRFFANMAANAPETAMGIAGSFAGPAGAALGSAGAHGIKRGVASLIFDEPTTPLQNLGGMAIEGGLSLAGDVPGRAIGAFGNRGTFVDMTPAQLRAAQDVQRRIKDTMRIDTDIAQASGNRRLIAMRQMLSRYSGKAADTFQELDERATGQFHEATDRVLDAIATAKPAEIAEAGGVNAADAAIRTAKRDVSNKVRPLYKAAYDANPAITDPEITKFMSLPFFPEAYEEGQRIAALEGWPAPKPKTTTTRTQHPLTGEWETTTDKKQVYDLRGLDYLKQGIDDVISRLEPGGSPTKLSGALRQQKKDFVEALDKLPSGEYKAARKLYGILYAASVAPLKNGPVGVLAQLKDKNAVGAAARVFGDSNVTDTQISLAKKAIEAENPDAWNDLTRTWLTGVFDKARTESQAGIEIAPGGKARKLVYGTPKLRKKMEQILPAGSHKDFDDLMFAAQKISSTPISGSNTMRDEEMKEVLKGNAIPVFKWITQFRKKTIDTAERIALEKGSEKLAIAMTDPTKIKHIRRVLRMKPSTQQAILLSTIIAARTAGDAARTALPEEDSINFAPAE
jgi:hypothetical protein